MATVFLWCLTGVECFCLKLFCFAGLHAPFLLRWIERGFFFFLNCWVFFFSSSFFFCLHWHFWVASFSSTKTGIYEAKRKLSKLTQLSFPSSQSPSPVCHLLSTFQMFMFISYIMSMVFSTISGSRKKYLNATFRSRGPQFILFEQWSDLLSKYRPSHNSS